MSKRCCLNSMATITCFSQFISNSNRTSCRLIRSVIIRVITKSDDRAAGEVRFVYHEYDYRLSWTTRGLIANNRSHLRIILRSSNKGNFIFSRIWSVLLFIPRDNFIFYAAQFYLLYSNSNTTQNKINVTLSFIPTPILQ